MDRERGSFLPAICAALIVAAAAQLAWRATIGGTIWIDEVYSILNAQMPLAKAYETAVTDTHPPAFYAAAHAALAAGGALGLPESPFLVRVPGLLLWAAGVFGAWWFARRMGMERFAWPAAAAAAWWPVFGGHALYVRGYGMAAVPFMLAAMILVRLRRDPATRRAGPLWGTYAALVAVALWTHPLSPVAAFLLGLLWIVFVAEMRPFPRRFAVQGAVAHAAAALSFAPWLANMRSQMHHQPPDWWMSERTVWNLADVFLYWLQVFEIDLFRTPWEPAGRLCSAGIVLLAGWLWWRHGRGDERGRLGALLCAACFLFADATWMLHALGVANTFHAPRYPTLVSGVWFAGLLLAGAPGLERARGARWAAAGLCAGLAIFGAYALHFAWLQRGYATVLTWNRDMLPPKGEPVYVWGKSLIPYAQPVFPDNPLRHVADLVSEPPASDRAVLLTLSPWYELDPIEEQVLHCQIDSGLVAKKVDKLRAATVLEGFDRKQLAFLAERKLLPNEPAAESAAARALARDQGYADGFSNLEANSDLHSFRWGRWPAVSVRFDKPVPAGRYTLKVKLFRNPYPTRTAAMSFWFDGQEPAEAIAEEGEQTLALDVDVPESAEPPTLRIAHPLWVPREHIRGSNDPRELTFLFFWAVLERKDEG